MEHNSRRGRQRLVSICDFVVALQSNRKWNVRNIKSFFCGFHLRRIGRCRCDVECGRYGDCCEDAAGVYDIEARSSLTSSQWTCLPLTTESDRRYRSDQNVSFHVPRSPLPISFHIFIYFELINFKSSLSSKILLNNIVKLITSYCQIVISGKMMSVELSLILV